MNKKITTKMILALVAVSYSDASAMAAVKGLFGMGEKKAVQEAAESAAKGQIKKDVSGSVKKALTADEVEKNVIQMNKAKVKEYRTQMKEAIDNAASAEKGAVADAKTSADKKIANAALKEKKIEKVNDLTEDARIEAANDKRALTQAREAYKASATPETQKALEKAKSRVIKGETYLQELEKAKSLIGLTENQTIAAGVAGAGVAGAAVGAGGVGLYMANKTPSAVESQDPSNLTLAQRLTR